MAVVYGFDVSSKSITCVLSISLMTKDFRKQQKLILKH